MPKMPMTFHNNSKDLLGMVNSAVCMIHCLAMPILIATGVKFLSHPLLEVLFVLGAAWAVQGAIGIRTPRGLRVAMWTLCIVFAVSILFEERHPWFEWCSLAASAGLIVAHLVNLTKRTLVPAN